MSFDPETIRRANETLRDPLEDTPKVQAAQLELDQAQRSFFEAQVALTQARVALQRARMEERSK